MGAVVVNQQELLTDISTDDDVLIVSECRVYSKITTSSSLRISASATFYDDVYCGALIIGNGAVPVRFKKNVHCGKLNSDGGVFVEENLVIDNELIFNGVDIEFGTMMYQGFVIETLKDLGKFCKTKPKKEGNNQLKTCTCQSGVCPVCSSSQNVPVPVPVPVPVDVVSSQSTAIEELLVCDGCSEQKPVQRIYGAGFHSILLCQQCVSQLMLFHASREECQRVPNDWEIANMSEDEKSFFAQNGYVTFSPRTPDEPFVRIVPESQDGEIQYKELSICDPQGKYLSTEDEENNRRIIRYNGGLFAWLFEGTFATWSAYAALVATPVVGPAVAVVGWVASLPMGWKISKKLTNLLNDKLILPQEVKARKELVEARRKDEKNKQDIHIETI